MTKAVYSPISEAAAQAFNSCVDGLVMKNISNLPALPQSVQFTGGDSFVGTQHVGAGQNLDPKQIS